jgi:hypothetical protein
MNSKFDELTKNMARAVTRRQAFKRLGVGLAGMALACFGLANNARADKVKTKPCVTDADCSSGQVCCSGACYAAIPSWCDPTVSCCCYCAGSGKNRYPTTALTPCNPSYNTCSNTCASAGSLLGCPGTWV